MLTTTLRRFEHNKHHKIVCSECGREAEVHTNKSHALPPNIVVKKFHEMGWQVGTNPHNDFCSECLAKTRGRRRQHLKDTTAMPSIPKTAPAPAPATFADPYDLIERLGQFASHYTWADPNAGAAVVIAMINVLDNAIALKADRIFAASNGRDLLIDNLKTLFETVQLLELIEPPPPAKSDLVAWLEHIAEHPEIEEEGDEQ